MESVGASDKSASKKISPRPKFLSPADDVLRVNQVTNTTCPHS
jgi:hypothetical protein